MGTDLLPDGIRQDVARVGSVAVGTVVRAKVALNDSGQQGTPIVCNVALKNRARGRTAYWSGKYNFSGPELRVQLTSAPGTTVAVNA
jgi:hypothetical protein